MHTRLNANKPTLNMTKTEFMLIGSGQRLNTIAASPSINLNERYSNSGETGCNYKITWNNNW